MPNDDIWNLPQEVLEYLSNRHLRVNRMQYYLYNVKDIIVLCKYWWIIPMYVTTRIPCKSEPDHTNGKPKHTIDEVFDLLVEFKKDQDEKWTKQEEFNKQMLDFKQKQDDFNKNIESRLDNLEQDVNSIKKEIVRLKKDNNLK